MKNEDVILLGRRAKDETENFINEHFENPDKGWPTVRINIRPSFNEYKEFEQRKDIYNSVFS